MNPSLDKELCSKYPILYAKRFLDGDVMSFGFEVGDGWHKIIDDLSAKIEKLNREQNAGIQAAQVKEKFGGLRFYIDGIPDALFKEVYAAIDEAEDLSFKTCESCGKPGKPGGRGWIKTLCEECRA